MHRLPASGLEQRYSDYYHASLETEPSDYTGRPGLNLANISLHPGITGRHERGQGERKATYLWRTREIFTSLWGVE